MELTKEQLEFLDRVVKGEWTLNSDGKVDVNSNVIMSSGEFTEIPFKFGRVEENFICSFNNLTTLKNSPDYVGGVFSCRSNNLTNLDYLPKHIEEELYISSNNLYNFFKNIKEEDFPYWKNFMWVWGTSSLLDEYPFLINICKNHATRELLKEIIEKKPKTKLYLK